MRLVTCAATLCLLIIFANVAQGWSCDGHELTAAVAYASLPDNVVQFFAPAFNQALDSENGPFPGITRTDEIGLACSPDDGYIRDSQDLKQQYPGIDSYHYLDMCFSDDGSCPADFNAGLLDSKLADVVATLTDAGKQGTLNSNDAAFAFTYLIHLAGDAHQPLHSCTYFNEGQFPQGDRGGNKFCTSAGNKKGRCKNNLHAFYDRIAMYSIGSRDVRQVAQDWIKKFPIADADAKNVDFTKNPGGWFGKESTVNCKDAHTDSGTNRVIVSGQPLSNGYKQYWQRKLQRQVVLGGRRLATILQSIYDAVQN